MTKLPSRFQIGDTVRVGKEHCIVMGVQFDESSVFYHVRTQNGIIGPLASIDVQEPFRVIEGRK